MPLSRRGLILKSSASLGLASLFVQAMTASAGPVESKKSSNSTTLIDATAQCMKTALLCIRHCQKELAQGNKIMAECQQSALETVASCEALQKLASYGSNHTHDFAQLTAKVCADCAKICEKHIAHMEICKACMEACKDCEKACLAA